MPNYRYYLLNDRNRIVGRGDFASSDDTAAQTIAELISTACPDESASYELWRDSERICGGKPPPTLRSRAEFDQHIQQAAADAETALQDSRWRIAESTQLLDAVQA